MSKKTKKVVKKVKNISIDIEVGKKYTIATWNDVEDVIVLEIFLKKNHIGDIEPTIKYIAIQDRSNIEYADARSFSQKIKGAEMIKNAVRIKKISVHVTDEKYWEGVSGFSGVSGAGGGGSGSSYSY